MLCGMAKRYLQKASVGGDGNPFRGVTKNSRKSGRQGKTSPVAGNGLPAYAVIGFALLTHRICG
jgi:hypothetical protein